MKKNVTIIIMVLIIVATVIGLLFWLGKKKTTNQKYVDVPVNNTLVENPKQIKLSDVELIASEAETDKLVRYNGIIYGKYFGIVCFAKLPEPIGEINKLIGSEYLPTENGQTNSEELLGAKVASVTDEGMVLIYNNDAIMYKAIEVKHKDDGLNVALSLEDEITENTAWCGTFNLIWNDLKNEIVKKDIVFLDEPDLEVIKNLNKGTFDVSNVSEDSYYKVFGVQSLELKEQIEKAIKEKFNETSDILDDFDWRPIDGNQYFLYTMLKKKFEFPRIFSELQSGDFGNYKNIEYFGINVNTSEQVRKQVKVLYYNSKDDFAIKLITKQNDEVIITRGTISKTFGDIYQEIKEKTQKYIGNNIFSNEDILKIPNINLNIKKEFKELENKPFKFLNSEMTYRIVTALQTIKLKLDKEGGEIKSEAGILNWEDSIAVSTNEPREFIIDDTFTMFLVEAEKELPYFAMKISNITNVQ